MTVTVAFKPASPAAHIAVVMHDFSTGGSERIAIRLANEWARSGRRVSILCGVTQGPARVLVDPRIQLVGVWPQIERSLLSRINLGGALAACARAIQPDVIFSPGNFHLPVVGVMARMMGDERPAIVCKLSNPLRRPGRSLPGQRMFDAITRRAIGPADAIVTMSNILAEEARSILGDRNVRRIYEPNLPAGVPGPRTASRPEKHPLIVCAGRLVRQKNFGLAIEAFAALDPELGARMLILGEGSQRTALEVLVEKRGLNDRVTFAGHVRDIGPSLARASLFLLSSRFEGYPAVLIEALAAGVPIVTTPCSPALYEIMMDPSFGHVVEATPSALATAMDYVLRVPTREAVNAQSLIARHRIDRVATEYLALFDETVASRRAWPVRQFA